MLKLILSNLDYMQPEKEQHEVATLNKGGKEEIGCNKELRLRPEENKWVAKEVAT